MYNEVLEKYMKISFVIFLTISIFMIFILNDMLTYGLIFILFMVLNSYFIIEKKFILFNPFTLFTLYFYSVIIVSLYSYITKFEHSIFVINQSFNSSIVKLLNISLVYIIVSYIFAYLGYICFKKDFIVNINLNNVYIPKIVLDVVIVSFAIIAIGNFYFNVLLFSSGNPLSYLENISGNAVLFKKFGGTTIGYLFGYTAGYVWLYKIVKMNKKISFLFVLYVAITFFMRASTGRIFGTLAYGLSYFVIYYFVYFKEQSRKHKQYFITLFLVALFGMFFYFFRAASSVDFDQSFLNSLNGDSLLYYAIDRGNLPNLAVLMKIIDGWGIDISFLYGQSLFTWVYGIIPSAIRPEGYQISAMIKHTWYSHIHGGNLPPTGMGEMYANFWYFGATFGMYIFGMFSAFIYNLLNRYNNYWCLVIYTNISLGFILLYAKGEFDNLSFWAIIPIAMTYLLIRLLTALLGVICRPIKTT